MALALLQRSLACLPGTSSLASAAQSCCRTAARLQHTQARKQIEDTWNKSDQTSLTSKKTETYDHRHEGLTPAERWSLTSSMFMDRAVQPGNTYSGMSNESLNACNPSSFYLLCFTGRSIEVNNGDIGNAFRRLDTIMSKNNVWTELRKTARHERKGEKRRRLESERFRRRFKEEVRSYDVLSTWRPRRSNEILPVRFEKECRWCWKYAVAARSPCIFRYMHVSVRLMQRFLLQVTDRTLYYRTVENRRMVGVGPPRVMYSKHVPTPKVCPNSSPSHPP